MAACNANSPTPYSTPSIAPQSAKSVTLSSGSAAWTNSPSNNAVSSVGSNSPVDGGSINGEANTNIILSSSRANRGFDNPGDCCGLTLPFRVDCRADAQGLYACAQDKGGVTWSTDPVHMPHDVRLVCGRLLVGPFYATGSGKFFLESSMCGCTEPFSGSFANECGSPAKPEFGQDFWVSIKITGRYMCFNVCVSQTSTRRDIMFAKPEASDQLLAFRSEPRFAKTDSCVCVCAEVPAEEEIPPAPPAAAPIFYPQAPNPPKPPPLPPQIINSTPVILPPEMPPQLPSPPPPPREILIEPPIPPLPRQIINPPPMTIPTPPPARPAKPITLEPPILYTFPEPPAPPPPAPPPPPPRFVQGPPPPPPPQAVIHLPQPPSPPSPPAAPPMRIPGRPAPPPVVVVSLPMQPPPIPPRPACPPGFVAGARPFPMRPTFARTPQRPFRYGQPPMFGAVPLPYNSAPMSMRPPNSPPFGPQPDPFGYTPPTQPTFGPQPFDMSNCEEYTFGPHPGDSFPGAFDCEDDEYIIIEEYECSPELDRQE